MKLKVDFEIANNNLSITHHDRFLLLGSCFSSEMEEQFKMEGFNVVSNPFGTLFHPNAIAENIFNLYKSESSAFVTNRDDLFFNFNFSGSIYGFSDLEIREKTESIYADTRAKIDTSNYLVVTFGTAWYYEHIEQNKIVGNCHKLAQSNFNKKIASVDEMYDTWHSVLAKIKTNNPSIKFIFNVSPVRHTKDGLKENNRSKARLLQLCERLEELDDCFYFPSYEVVIDELRDYRFYKSDLVHPNQSAVEYVWSKFKGFAFDRDAIKVGEKVRNLNQNVLHRSLYPDSNSDTKRLEKLKLKKSQIASQHPDISWFYFK